MHSPEMQAPGLALRASRDLLRLGWSQPLNTAPDWQAQMLSSRFCLQPWIARLYFGKVCHD